MQAAVEMNYDLADELSKKLDLFNAAFSVRIAQKTNERLKNLINLRSSVLLPQGYAERKAKELSDKQRKVSFLYPPPRNNAPRINTEHTRFRLSFNFLSYISIKNRIFFCLFTAL
jgi:hypothetical protein